MHGSELQCYLHWFNVGIMSHDRLGSCVFTSTAEVWVKLIFASSDGPYVPWMPFCVSQSNSAELQLKSSSTSDPRGFDVGRFIRDRRNQSQAAAFISHHLSLQTAPGHLLAGILNYTGVGGHQLETVVAVGVTVSITSWHLRAHTHTHANSCEDRVQLAQTEESHTHAQLLHSCLWEPTTSFSPLVLFLMLLICLLLHCWMFRPNMAKASKNDISALKSNRQAIFFLLSALYDVTKTGHP